MTLAQLPKCRPTRSQVDRAYAYAASIRNRDKQAYAHAIIDLWDSRGEVDEAAYATDLSYMARQAVRMRLDAILALA